MKSMVQKQLGIQENRTISVKRIDSIGVEDECDASKIKLENMKSIWKIILENKFKEQLKIEEEKFLNNKDSKLECYPCLILMDPKDYVDIMVSVSIIFIDSMISEGLQA